MQLETPRLILRAWRDTDTEPFAELNADPAVMEFFPKMLTRQETVEMIERIKGRFDEEGFGLYATELKETGEFIGFIGLIRPRIEAHFTPCVEIGWRIARRFWGKGYAPEGAAEALRSGFTDAKLDEIVSMTSKVNAKSIRVMEKLRMTRDPNDDFMHPAIDDGHPLKPHVLYRLSQSAWSASQQN